MGYVNNLNKTDAKLERIHQEKERAIAQKRAKDFMHKMDKEDNIKRI
jgi:hypothetical protein